MIVYYMTGQHESLPQQQDIDGETVSGRADIAKFFTRADAEAHINRRHGNWRKLQVEEREETSGEQRPVTGQSAHGHYGD